MGPRCKSAACVKSSRHHCSKIGETDREKIYEYFWVEQELGKEKSTCSWFGRCHPPQRRKGSENPRSSTLIFFEFFFNEKQEIM